MGVPIHPAVPIHPDLRYFPCTLIWWCINIKLCDAFSFFNQELKDESGRLYKLLSERDYEIRKLKKQRDEDRQAIAGNKTDPLAVFTSQYCQVKTGNQKVEDTRTF